MGAYHKFLTIEGYALGNGLTRRHRSLGGTAGPGGVTEVSRPKVLIVDDDPNSRRLITTSLKQDCDVVAGTDHRTCLELLGQASADLIVLDVVARETDGWETLKWVRTASPVPVVVVSVRSDVLARIHALQLGADDFVTKPFNGSELAARVIAVLRRYPHRSRGQEAIQRGSLFIDKTQLCATWRGRPLALTRKEFKLLALLASIPGEVFPRDRLVGLVWGDKGAVGARTVDSHIKNIRHELKDGAQLIVTERGLGYRFVDPPIS